MARDGQLILVTGARGFIGRAVSNLLAKRGCHVHATKQLACQPDPYPDDPVTWHTINLLHREAVAELMVALRPSVIIHLAWESANHWNAPSNLDWTAATLHMAKCFADCGGERFIGIGSCAEYDWRLTHDESVPFDEVLTSRRAVTLYGIAKNATYDVLSKFFEMKGIAFCWGAVFHAYGPGESRPEIISAVTMKLLRGEPAYCTTGNQFRDFIYLDDVAEAVAALLSASAVGRFNIATGVGTSVRDVVIRIGELLCRPDLVRLGVLPDDPSNVVARIDRIASEVHWTPRVSVDEGVQRTLDWWRRKMNHQYT